MPRSSHQKAKRPWPTLKLNKSSFPLGKRKLIVHRGERRERGGKFSFKVHRLTPANSGRARDERQWPPQLWFQLFCPSLLSSLRSPRTLRRVITNKEKRR